VVCVSGDARRRELADLICPVRGNSRSGLAAIVAAGPRNDGAPYSDEDHRLATALCGHISELLGHQSDPDNHESEIARGIFDRLDQGCTQRIPGIEFSGQCHRTHNPGGDFFDLLPRRQRELIVAIGSVAAHGLPGGIILGRALGSVRALASRGESLVQIALELNRTMWELSPEGLFTSFLCAHVDPSSRRLRYVNAGHEPALLLHGRSGHVEQLDPTGAVLGLSCRSVYRERLVPFEPGDLLAAYTEGVAESTGGPSRVLRLLREDLDCGVQDLAARVLAAGDSLGDRTIVLVRSHNAEDCPLPMERAELAAA
jgi:sigma-B regulation protein RsbU (phosphoserine phosphatase)